ncbi:serine hydrolase [Alkaliphilus transvaalensis]|uniref:serine hydrolase n=1 Tax=Alkaliphilus transvaalensis TaxID=114628 RepID=UPI00068537F7|nr:serine hydrolase [Alkaliphilus transvaalensis]
MKKRRLCLSLSILLIIFSTFTTFAGGVEKAIPSTPTNLSIIIDGSPLITTGYDFYVGQDGLTMYPLRLIAENLGGEVFWDASSNTTLIANEKGSIYLNPTTASVMINGVNKKINYSFETFDSRLYVPSDFFRDVYGARIKIDAGTVNFISPALSLESSDLTAPEEEIKTALASYLTSLELNRNFSGQILVSNSGRILLDRSYGYSDFENKINAFNSTNFAIGSVTKQFVAAAIVQLAEVNKLSYDDTISKYLDNVPFGDEITIHQLLTHTSGLFNYTDLLPNMLEQDLSELTFPYLMTLIKDKPLDFEPGTNFNYSNTGYLILGEIVEEVTGKTLETYLTENIFLPLGMKNTSIAYRLEERLVEAKGYTGHTEVVEDHIDRLLLNMAYGAGYLASTAQDLYKWNSALLGWDIVSGKGLETLFGKSPDMNLMVPYAYGWMINTGELGEEISHGGNTIGFTSENAIFTDADVQIIILTNKGYADLQSIKSDIISILNGKEVEPLEEITYVTVSEEQLNKYIGSYEIKDLLKIDIFVHEGSLMLQGEDQPAIELAPTSVTTYESPMFGIAIEFDNIDDPTYFILHQSGLQLKAEKIQ